MVRVYDVVFPDSNGTPLPPPFPRPSPLPPLASPQDEMMCLVIQAMVYNEVHQLFLGLVTQLHQAVVEVADNKQLRPLRA